jgi:hypothetical protein
MQKGEVNMKSESIIKEIIKEQIDKITEPDSLPSIDALEYRKTKIKEKEYINKKAAARLKIFLTVAAIMGFVFIVNIEPLKARNSLIENIFTQVKDGIQSIFKTNTDSNIPNNETLDTGIFSYEVISMDEVKVSAGDSFRFPTYIVEGFNPNRITIHKADDKITEVHLDYVNEHGHKIRYIQAIIFEGRSSNINYKNESSQIEEFQINGINYILIMSSNGFNTLIWDQYGMDYRLSGFVEKEELKKMLEIN